MPIITTVALWIWIAYAGVLAVVVLVQNVRELIERSR